MDSICGSFSLLTNAQTRSEYVSCSITGLWFLTDPRISQSVPSNVSFLLIFLFLSKPFQRARPVIDYGVALGDSVVGNPLQTLLEMPTRERVDRGLEHTPREIWQQPETWGGTYRRCSERIAELRDTLRRAGIGRGTSSPTVYLIGAGTSDYTGRALAPLLRRCWGCEAWAVPSTTLLTDFDDFHATGKEYFWISFSRSGDSPESVAVLERALEKNRSIHHVVITCNQNGAMAGLCARYPERALALVLDDTVNDRGLAMTSSFSNMLIAGQCVAHLEDLENFGSVVSVLSDCGRQFLLVAAETAAE